MLRMACGLVLLLLLACPRLVAVEYLPTGTYEETAPTDSNIANWQTGWAQPPVQPTGYTSATGWNYVGIVAGNLSTASGVYLGNGWVLTCAHVGYGTFTLNHVAYSYVPNSVHTFSSGSTQYDFVVFQISPAPDLPALPLRKSDPVVNSSKVALLGYGDGGSQTNETWGYDTINDAINQSTPLFSYITNDFWILNGSKAEYQIVGGDSGGGDFIYNSSTGEWELAGLNEAILQNESGDDVGSACVQLDTYATQIDAVVTPPVSEPTMPTWGLILLGALLAAAAVPGVALRPSQ